MGQSRDTALGLATILLAAWLTVGVASVAQVNPPRKTGITVSTHQFQLLTEGKQFFLHSTSPSGPQRVPIPRDWLVSPQEEKNEEDSPVSSFLYDRHATSFPIGNAEIGVQLSSYAMMTEGSLQAAEGRDVFLIYEPATGKLRPGHLDFGITKERFRDMGCWHAKMVHFVVSDVNQDGFTDIGTVEEEIRCPEGENRYEGDSYEQHVFHWYLYTADGWERETVTSAWPDKYSDLPLIGMDRSPVDFVGQGLWGSADPALWKGPPFYLPAYRKKLIAAERQKKSATQPKSKVHP